MPETLPERSLGDAAQADLQAAEQRGERSCYKAPDSSEDQPAQQVSPPTLNAPSAHPLASGLYLVATPIGNLEDITLRALRVLASVDRVACEDTRQTQKLLGYYGISTPSVSLHAHNEGARTPELLNLLKDSGRVAVVSDAGTPGISDPGMHLVAAAIAAGVAVYPVPGANAALSALVASGLPTTSFTFHGFLPEKSGGRRTELERLSAATSESTTLIFYEAPHRILDTLSDLAAIWPAARVAVARELTKLHEEFLRGTAAEIRRQLAARDRIRGEIVLLVEAPPAAASPARTTGTIHQRVTALMADEAGLDERAALKQVARERNLGKSEAYRELQRERGKRS